MKFTSLNFLKLNVNVGCPLSVIFQNLYGSKHSVSRHDVRVEGENNSFAVFPPLFKQSEWLK